MTSAPMSASSMVENGPERTRVRSITRMPVRGWTLTEAESLSIGLVLMEEPLQGHTSERRLFQTLVESDLSRAAALGPRWEPRQDCLWPLARLIENSSIDASTRKLSWPAALNSLQETRRGGQWCQPGRYCVRQPFINTDDQQSIWPQPLRKALKDPALEPRRE